MGNCGAGAHQLNACAGYGIALASAERGRVILERFEQRGRLGPVELRSLQGVDHVHLLLLEEHITHVCTRRGSHVALQRPIGIDSRRHGYQKPTLYKRGHGPLDKCCGCQEYKDDEKGEKDEDKRGEGESASRKQRTKAKTKAGGVEEGGSGYYYYYYYYDYYYDYVNTKFQQMELERR